MTRRRTLARRTGHTPIILAYYLDFELQTHQTAFLKSVTQGKQIMSLPGRKEVLPGPDPIHPADDEQSLHQQVDWTKEEESKAKRK